MSTLNTNIKYNSVRDKSFGLLRTNPKLTTNAKIVVDSSDNIFLSSFSATKQLSSSEFKRFKLSGLGLYSMDLSRFYGNVPMTERFEVMRKFSDITSYNEYSKQFENQYNYGAEFNDTKLYDEQYKFLAPIWLNKDIPSNFVIYRVETATSTNIQNPSSYLGQNEKIMDMLGNATIVANFDLSRRSKIGGYIRNHVEDITMPSAGLTFNFDTEEPCIYRGIDVKYGGFTNKEEYLADDYIRTDDLEINKNELLTEGFERNGLAFSNILNLEFMFDDKTGEKYKTYRYFGLYVDSIKEGGLKLSSITSDYLLYNSASSVYDVSGLSLSDEASRLFMVPGNGELNLPTLNYIKDKYYNLYHIKNKSRGINENRINLNISDLEAFSGYSEKHSTLTIDQNTRSFKSFIKIKIKDIPNHLDRFFIGNRFTMKEDSYNMGTYTILVDSNLPAGQYSGNSFSNQGSLSQIAAAISNVIKNTIDEGRVEVTPVGEYVIIESYVVGEDRNQMMFGVYNNNLVDFIEIITSNQNDMGLNTVSSSPSPTITFTDWSIHTLRGGAGKNQGMLIKSNEHGDLAVGDYIKEKDLETYVIIIDIVRDFNGKDYRVILKKPAVLSNNGIVKLYNKFDAEFGKLSAYDLKDLRFDFHDNDISGLGSLEFDLGFGSYETNGNIDLQKLNNIRFNGLIDNILGAESVGRISNIYGRLKENKLKETAILSRIVPHINAFARKDSSNIRGNDYILNVNESMGVDNMSPNSTTTRSDYRFMNIEHYTMGQLPKLQAAVRNRNIGVTSVELITNGDFSATTGSELVGNGDFSGGAFTPWANNTNWALGGVGAIADGTNSSTLWQDSVVEDNKSYKVTYTLSDFTQGSINVDLGGTNGATRAYSGATPVTYTDYIVSGTSQTTRLTFEGSGNFIVTLSNVSVKELGEDWTLGTGWSVAAGGANWTSPGTNNNNAITQAQTFTSGKTYKLSFTVSNRVVEAKLDPRLWKAGPSYDAFHSGYVDYAAGDHVLYITADDDYTDLQINAEDSSSTSFTLSRVSVREVTSGDLIPNTIDRSLYNIDDSLLFAYADTTTSYITGADFISFDVAKAKDTAFDYFSLFESFNGYFNYITSDFLVYPTNAATSEVWEDMKKVNHSDIIRRGSVFSKGVHYNFSESLDGYRFMNVLRYEHSTDTNDTSIEVIKNEKYETLVIFTTIKTKANVIPEYGLTKGHMYSVNDITTYSTSSNTGLASLNPSIPAAWDIYGDTSNAAYTQVPLTLVDTPIKSTFDYGGSLWPSINSPGNSLILNASSESILTGDARFNSQIVKNNIGEYSYIIFEDSADSTNKYAVKILDVISDTSILIGGFPLGLTFPSGVFTLGTTPYTSMPSHEHDDFTLTLHEGGLNGFRGLFDSVCVGSIAKRFSSDTGISHSTIDLLGVEKQKGPKVKIMQPATIVKVSEKRVVGDTDKPSAFAVATGSVGYIVVDKEIKYLTKLKRHNGDYNPAVKNIISFDSIYNKHKLNYGGAPTDTEIKESLIYGKFNGLGIAFESYKNSIENYGIIKNFYYHKVNENAELDIIKLSESSDKLPLYPLIGEIAIDKTDLNILDSKYSDSFFKRGLIGVDKENAHGTKSAEEVKAFMASTIMKVDDIYNIDTFVVGKKHTSLNDLNTTYEDDLNTESIHFFEDEYRIFADFYVTDALRETLITDGISYKFSENIDASKSYGDTTTLDDDISEYVKHNIVNRYIIDSIDVYVNESRDIETGFFSDVSQLDDYKKSSSHSLESFNDKEIGFRFIFEKRVGYNYGFKVNIKIKA